MHEFEAYLERLRAVLNVNPRREQEICTEVQSHLEALVEKLQQSGHSPEQAAQEAMASFGQPESLAKLLTRANHRHRRWPVLLAAPLGAAIGTVVLISMFLTLVLLHLIPPEDRNAIYDSFILFGALPGIFSGLLVAALRLRTRTVAALLAVSALLYSLLWYEAFLHSKYVVVQRCHEALPVVLLCSAVLLAVGFGVNEWILSDSYDADSLSDLAAQAERARD